MVCPQCVEGEAESKESLNHAIQVAGFQSGSWIRNRSNNDEEIIMLWNLWKIRVEERHVIMRQCICGNILCAWIVGCRESEMKMCYACIQSTK